MPYVHPYDGDFDPDLADYIKDGGSISQSGNGFFAGYGYNTGDGCGGPEGNGAQHHCWTEWHNYDYLEKWPDGEWPE